MSPTVLTANISEENGNHANLVANERALVQLLPSKTTEGFFCWRAYVTSQGQFRADSQTAFQLVSFLFFFFSEMKALLLLSGLTNNSSLVVPSKNIPPSSGWTLYSHVLECSILVTGFLRLPATSQQLCVGITYSLFSLRLGPKGLGSSVWTIPLWFQSFVFIIYASLQESLFIYFFPRKFLNFCLYSVSCYFLIVLMKNRIE